MKPLFCDETYTKLLNQMPEEVIGDRDIFKKDNWYGFKEIVNDWSDYVLDVKPRALIGYKADKYFESQLTLSSSSSNQIAQLPSVATNIDGQNDADQDRKLPARPNIPSSNLCASSGDNRYLDSQEKLSVSSSKHVTKVSFSTKNLSGQNSCVEVDNNMEENILPATPNNPCSKLCENSEDILGKKLEGLSVTQSSPNSSQKTIAVAKEDQAVKDNVSSTYIDLDVQNDSSDDEYVPDRQFSTKELAYIDASICYLSPCNVTKHTNHATKKDHQEEDQKLTQVPGTQTLQQLVRPSHDMDAIPTKISKVHPDDKNRNNS